MRIPVQPGEGISGIRDLLIRNWWAVALRGVIGIIFGLVAFIMPGITLLTLVLLLAAYLLADGVLAIVAGVRAARLHERWWPFAVEGIADIVAGILAAAWPQVTVLALMYLLAIWAIFTGVVVIFGGFQIGLGAPRWLLWLGGVLSILLGIFMIGQPALGVLALAWWIGSYALAFGVVLLVFGLWLRSHRSETGHPQGWASAR